MRTARLLVGNFAGHLEVLDFDAEAGSLDCTTLRATPLASYTWISPHPVHDDLFYGVKAAPTNEGTLTVFKLKRGSRSDDAGLDVEVVQNITSAGRDPCHAAVSPKADEIVMANYDSNLVSVYKLNVDGTIVETSLERHNFKQAETSFKTGPDVNGRQEAPHPHGCFYSQTLNDWIIPDLGSDKLRLLRDGGFLPCRPGAGPRHVALPPDGEHVYAVNELDNTVTVHSLKSRSVPSDKHRLSILPSDVEKGLVMNGAAILLTEDGRFLYATNRLEQHPDGDAIVWFSVSGNGDTIQRLGEIRSGLDHPRCAYLFSAEQKNYLIAGSKTQTGAVIYERKDDGSLVEVARQEKVQHPSCFSLLSPHLA